MQNIKNFLEKFQKFLKTDKELKNSIIESIKKETGIDLKDSDLKIQEKIVYIKERPVIKSEIFLKKDKILNSLSDQIKDLR